MNYLKNQNVSIHSKPNQVNDQDANISVRRNSRDSIESKFDSENKPANDRELKAPEIEKILEQLNHFDIQSVNRNKFIFGAKPQLDSNAINDGVVDDCISNCDEIKDSEFELDRLLYKQRIYFQKVKKKQNVSADVRITNKLRKIRDKHLRKQHRKRFKNKKSHKEKVLAQQISKLKTRKLLSFECDLTDKVKESLVQILLKVQEKHGYEIALKLKNILMKYSNCFGKSKFDFGLLDFIEYAPKLIDPNMKPIGCKPYNYPPPTEAEIEKTCEILEAAGIISEYNGPWGQPLVYVINNDGSSRICTDASRVNKHTVKDTYPVPNLQSELLKLRNKKIFSSVDIVKAFHNVPVAESSKHLTAFVTHKKSYVWNVMPFGGCNCPAVWARASDMAFKHCVDLVKYVDDIVIASDSIDSHFVALDGFFQRLTKYKLKLKITKCDFLCTEIDFVGHHVTTKGVRPKKKYVKEVLQMKHPRNKAEIIRYCGVVGWLSKYIPRLKHYLAPIAKQKKKRFTYNWTPECQQAFLQIQHLIDKCDMLHHPDFNKEFFIWVDSSDYAYGAALMQSDGKDGFVPIEFMSRAWTDGEERLHITSKELIALINSLTKWNKYLFNPFTVHTDAKNIVHLWNATNKKSTSNNKHWRWMNLLKTYPMTVRFVKGIENTMADYLSRDIDYDALKEGTKEIIPQKKYKINMQQIFVMKQDCEFDVGQYLQNERIIESDLMQNCKILEGKSMQMQNTKFGKFYNSIIDEFHDNQIRTNVGSKVGQNDGIQMISDQIEHKLYATERINYIQDAKHVIFEPKVEKSNGTLIHKYMSKVYHCMNPNKIPSIHMNNKLFLLQCLLQRRKMDELLFPQFDAADAIDRAMDVDDASSNDSDSDDSSEWQYNRSYAELDALQDEYDIIDIANDLDSNEIYPEMFNTNKLIQNQKIDPIIGIIRRKLDGLDYYDDFESLRKYVQKDVNDGLYKLDDNVLLRWNANKSIFAVVLPVAHRQLILKLVHEYENIHPGIEYTTRQVMKYFYWPGMRSDIKNYVKTCDNCQRNKYGKKGTYGKLKLFSCRKFNEMVAIDHFGPLPPNEESFRFITTYVDRFSGYVLSVPVRRIDAFTTAINFHRKWILRFGICDSLLSDQGSDLCSKIMRNLCTICGIDKRRTTSYHANTNGTVERWHKTLKQCLMSIGSDSGVDVEGIDDWTLYIDQINAFHNARISRRTDMSPNRIVFGQDIKTTIEYNLDLNKFNVRDTEQHLYSGYIANLRKIAEQQANIKLDKYDENRKYFSDAKRVFMSFKLGDLVLYTISQIKHEGKFKQKWKGPYTVVEKMENGINYRILDESTGRSKVVAVSKLKKYNTRQQLVDEQKQEEKQDANSNEDDRDEEEEKALEFSPHPENELSIDEVNELVSSRSHINSYYETINENALNSVESDGGNESHSFASVLSRIILRKQIKDELSDGSDSQRSITHTLRISVSENLFDSEHPIDDDAATITPTPSTNNMDVESESDSIPNTYVISNSGSIGRRGNFDFDDISIVISPQKQEELDRALDAKDIDGMVTPERKSNRESSPGGKLGDLKKSFSKKRKTTLAKKPKTKQIKSQSDVSEQISKSSEHLNDDDVLEADKEAIRETAGKIEFESKSESMQADAVDAEIENEANVDVEMDSIQVSQESSSKFSSEIIEDKSTGSEFIASEVEEQEEVRNYPKPKSLRRSRRLQGKESVNYDDKKIRVTDNFGRRKRTYGTMNEAVDNRDKLDSAWHRRKRSRNTKTPKFLK